jgi:hypothetical protein
MFSKLTLRHLGLLGSVFLVLCTGWGCSFRKNAPSSSQFNISAGQLGCLDKAGTQVQSFFHGTATDTDLDQVWDCTKQVLNDFSSDTRGATAGSYSSLEMRNFLAKYFIHEVNLTDSLMVQVGLVKQALVGGTSDRMSLDEIRKLQALFEVLRTESKRLRPFMPLGPRTGEDHWTGIANIRWRDVGPEL